MKETKLWQPLFADGHLTEKAMKALKSGMLEGEALDAALSHLGNCGTCADTFARAFDETELAAVPPDFGAEIRRKITGGTKDRQFAFYVCRVALAACVALVLTFSGAFETVFSWQEKAESARAPDFRTVDRISADLRDFSQNILNLEAFGYAAKKK